MNALITRLTAMEEALNRLREQQEKAQLDARDALALPAGSQPRAILSNWNSTLHRVNINTRGLAGAEGEASRLYGQATEQARDFAQSCGNSAGVGFAIGSLIKAAGNFVADLTRRQSRG